MTGRCEVIAVVDVTRSMLARRAPTGPIRLDRARAARQASARRARDAGRGGVAHRPGAAAPLPDARLDRVRRIDDRPRDRDRGRRPSAARTSATAPSPRSATSAGRRSSASGPGRAWRSSSPTARPCRSTSASSARSSSAARSRPSSSTSGRGTSRSTAGERDLERYRPDPGQRSGQRLAREVGGRVFTEQQVRTGDLSERPAALGTGPVAHRAAVVSAPLLAPYALLAAVLPLGFVLLRRNLLQR